MMWYITHIVPRIHWTVYKEDGVMFFEIWRQWLWWTWDSKKIIIKAIRNMEEP